MRLEDEGAANEYEATARDEDATDRVLGAAAEVVQLSRHELRHVLDEVPLAVEGDGESGQSAPPPRIDAAGLEEGKVLLPQLKGQGRAPVPPVDVVQRAGHALDRAADHWLGPLEDLGVQVVVLRADDLVEVGLQDVRLVQLAHEVPAAPEEAAHHPRGAVAELVDPVP